MSIDGAQAIKKSKNKTKKEPKKKMTRKLEWMQPETVSREREKKKVVKGKLRAEVCIRKKGIKRRDIMGKTSIVRIVNCRPKIGGFRTIDLNQRIMRRTKT